MHIMCEIYGQYYIVIKVHCIHMQLNNSYFDIKIPLVALRPMTRTLSFSDQYDLPGQSSC